jgi:NAD(P)-dependent dehydrogenase (short-subunit alcohol dehydrogenase family)
MMPGKLEAKIALVTGGSSGIGLAVAQRFAREGAFVFVTGRRRTELEKAAKLIGAESAAIQADVASLADLDKVYQEIKQRKGRLDVLVANAGGGTFAPLGAISEEHFDQTFGTNVKGTLFTVQKALPMLSDGAAIILTGSTAGSEGIAAFGVYAATKAAIRSFARTWATDLKERKIRVNVISPGPIETPGLAGLASDDDTRRGMYAAFASQIPLGRLGQPDEVARVASFLASEDASFVNGIELFVDGGAAQV